MALQTSQAGSGHLPVATGRVTVLWSHRPLQPFKLCDAFWCRLASRYMHARGCGAGVIYRSKIAGWWLRLVSHACTYDHRCMSTHKTAQPTCVPATASVSTLAPSPCTRERRACHRSLVVLQLVVCAFSAHARASVCIFLLVFVCVSASARLPGAWSALTRRRPNPHTRTQERHSEE